MKPLKPQKIAGLTTLGFLVLTLIFFFINYHSPDLYFSLSVSIPVFFGLAFFLVRFFIIRFFYSGIEPLYKALNIFKSDDRRSSGDGSPDETDKNVESWIKGKADEIQQLKQMEKYRKEFIGNVSHELKTPVFNVQGYVLTLLDGGIDDPAINELYLRRTEKSIERMISIIEDLESIAKLESGEIKPQFENFYLDQLVEEVFDLHEMRAKEKGINLLLKNDINRPVLVKADKQRILEALSNLVVNSISYGKKNGETVVNVYDMVKNVLVEVKDNGIGISEKHLPRIFERFYRVDKSRSREQGGTGLGLSIVKHILEAHDQTINVNSEPGKGTSFTFTLEKALGES